MPFSGLWANIRKSILNFNPGLKKKKKHLRASEASEVMPTASQGKSSSAEWNRVWRPGRRWGLVSSLQHFEHSFNIYLLKCMLEWKPKRNFSYLIFNYRNVASYAPFWCCFSLLSAGSFTDSSPNMLMLLLHVLCKVFLLSEIYQGISSTYENTNAEAYHYILQEFSVVRT